MNKDMDTKHPPCSRDDGRWAAATAGFCAVAFSMAVGAIAAPILTGTGSAAPEAWLAGTGSAGLAFMFSRMAGKVMEARCADQAFAETRGRAVTAVTLAAALTAGFFAFTMAEETGPLKAGAQSKPAAAVQKEAPKTAPPPEQYHIIDLFMK